jgi:hypothetical protein
MQAELDEAKKERRRNQEHMLLSPSLSVWHSERRTSIAKIKKTGLMLQR